MKKIILPLLLVLTTSVWVNAQCLKTAPYLQTFDNDTTPTCWDNPVSWFFGIPMYWYFANQNNSNPNFPPTGLAANVDDHTGNNGYFTFMYKGLGNSFNLTSPEIDVSGLTTPGLTFWMFEHTKSALNNKVAIDIYDGTWNFSVATFDQSSPNWKYRNVNLSAYAGDTIKVRFRRLSTFNSKQDLLIDDVLISEQPTCFPPNNAAIDSVNATQVFVNISGTTAHVWEYEYGSAGFSIGSGTRDTTSANSVTLNNLTPNTAYQLYIRNKCSTTDTSVWLQRNFTTLCAVSPTPFLETFDTTVTPACWSNYSLNAPGYFVGFSKNEDYTNNNGASAYWSYWASTVILNLETPQIDISNLTQPYLSFFRKALPLNNVPLNGYVTVEGFDGNNWIKLKSFNQDDPNWQYKFIDLSGFSLPDTTGFRLVYKRKGGANVGDDYLDNFTIGEKPNCLPTDSMWVNAILTNAASLKFSAATSRQVEWGARGYLHGSGNFVNTNTNSAILTGTQPNTWYTAYFRDSCGTGYGEWSQAIHFQTTCPTVFNAPYKQTFNNLPIQDSTLTGACWTAYKVGKTNWVVDGWTLSGSTGPEVRHDGLFVYTEASGGDSADASYIESPNIDLSTVSNPYLSFYYHMFGNTMGNLCVEIYNGSIWQPLGTCLIGQQQSTATSPWKRKVISLSAYANTTVKVRFEGIRGPNWASDMALDDVWIMDSCTAAKPIAGFTAVFDTLSFAGYRVNFTSNATGAISILWNFGDGTTDTGLAVTHTYTTNGSFTVSQKVLNACADVDSTSQTIVAAGIGIAELENLGINVYPNPANNILKIESKQAIGTILLTDLNGRVILQLTTQERNIAWNISELENGVYFLRFVERNVVVKLMKME